MTLDSVSRDDEVMELPPENESREAPFVTFKAKLVELKYKEESDEGIVEKPYFAIEVPKAMIEPYLAKLKERLGEMIFNAAVEAKAARDGADVYHITVVRPPELKANPVLVRVAQELLLGKEMEINLLGIGSVSDGQNTAYYAIAESADIDNARAEADEETRLRALKGKQNHSPLGKHHLHSTLGFLGGDVHNSEKPKDRDSQMIPMTPGN